MSEIKTFYIKTYGCQMNELDSETITGQLLKRGLTQVHNENEADIIIFNTCSVRDLAERKVMGKIGKIGQTKKRNAIIGVMGCMAMAKKETLLDKFPHLNFVLGTNNIHNLNHVLDNVINFNDQISQTNKEYTQEIDYNTIKRKDKLKAYVSVIRGCNKHCTYCIVPYTRGKEVSRNKSDVIEECKTLAEQGYKEICLLGQNVNSYGKDKNENYHFHDLLYDIDKINGIKRIRFMTSHPVDITKSLMLAIRDLPSVCEFVHFPMQAGNNRILRKMCRHYTIEEYCEKVHLLREIVPNSALGTDIIIGFPTENDEEFEETYNKMKEIKFSTAFIFAYSPRKNTPAMRFKDDIPEQIKQERLQQLLQLQENIYKKQFNNLIGTTTEVLVDRKNKDQKLLRGRTRCWRKVVFPGQNNLIGTIQSVKITGFNHQTLLGEITTT